MRDRESYNTEGFRRVSKKICKNCGATFEGVRSKLYCDTSCTRKANYAMHMFDPEYRLRKLVAMAKSRAKEKDLPFDLTLDFMLELWEHNQGACEILKIPLDLGKSDLGKVHPYAPSIDRIVPEMGYTQGNVRIISYQLNVALSEFGLEQFNELVNIYVAAR